MAGYSPSSFFFIIFWVFRDRDGVEVHKRRTIIIWKNRTLPYGGTKRVIPSGQDSAILPHQVANLSARFGSSFPVTELVFIFHVPFLICKTSLQISILFEKTQKKHRKNYKSFFSSVDYHDGPCFLRLENVSNDNFKV